MEHYFHEALDIVILLVEAFAVLVLIWGAALAVKSFVAACFTKKGKPAAQVLLMTAKIELGRYILLGLELLIAADIMESILDPGWQEILILAAVVAVRTVIAFFLNREIRETNEEVREGVDIS